MKVIIPCIMGLERLVGDELEELGFTPEQVRLQNAEVWLDLPDNREALSRGIARTNMGVACGERVEVELAAFKATTFDSFFDQAAQLSWEDYVPDGWFIHVSGYSRKSALFSTSDLQSLLKLAIVRRLLSKRYPGSEELPEDQAQGRFRVRFAFQDDVCSLRVDTSGPSMHKRGYRTQATLAPMKETLAAALLRLMRWEPFSDEALLDPMCGSGTIAIEAARLAAGIAPGVQRRFDGEKWPFLDRELWDEERMGFAEQIDNDAPDEPFIFASDIDENALAVTRKNIARARVEGFIVVQQRDIRQLRMTNLSRETGYREFLMLCNPPYGERMGETDDVRALSRILGRIALTGDQQLQQGLRCGIITAEEHFERDFGRRADKRRKLYNGMIPAMFYQYFRTFPKN